MAARNKYFESDYEPFHDNRSLQLRHDQVDGPFSFFNPTAAPYNYVGAINARWDDESTELQDHSTAERSGLGFHRSEVEYKWTSRNNRKGRHTLVLREAFEGHAEETAPPYATGFRAVLKGIWRMFTRFSFRDITYLVAVAFALGCIVLLINACLTFLPYADPSFKSSKKASYAEAALSLLGSTLFLTGGFLSYLEAVNADRKGCFGWRLEHVIQTVDISESRSERGAITRVTPDGQCTHYYHNPSNLDDDPEESPPDDFDNIHRSKLRRARDPWRWYPPREELRRHYIRELGFLASFILCCSSCLYCMASIALLVTTLKSGDVPRWIRGPQAIAALGFTVASTLLTLETQHFWLRPEIKALGWYIGLWNTIGSFGLLLCAIFGFMSNTHWAEYQFGCSYLWGTLAFSIGSILQWYEAVDRFPLKTLKKSQ